MKTFAVVEFCDEKTVEAVPSKWLVEQNKVLLCYWPNDKKSEQVYNRIQDNEEPDMIEWEKYKIRVLASYDSFLKAEAIADKALDTSNFEDECEQKENKERRKKRKDKVSYEVCPDEVLNETPPPKKRRSSYGYKETAPATPQYTSQVSHHSRNSDFHQQNHSPTIFTQSRQPRLSAQQMVPLKAKNSTDRSTSQSRQPAEASQELSHWQLKMEEMVRQLMTNVDVLKETMQKEMREIRDIIGKKNSQGQYECNDLFLTPIKSVAALKKIDKEMYQHNSISQIVSLFISKGGHSVKESVTRIMELIATTSVWESFSFKGRNENKKFSFVKLQLCNAIIKAVMKHNDIDISKVVEDVIAEFLKRCPHKPGGSKYEENQQNKTRGELQQPLLPMESD